MSEADLPSLHAIFEEWRPGVEGVWAAGRPTTREALPIVTDLLEQLHRRIVAATLDRTPQLEQLHELLLAAFAGTLSAVDTPTAGTSPVIEERAGREITLGWRQVTPVITVSIRAEDLLRRPRPPQRHRPERSHPGLPEQAPPVLDWSALLDQLGGALEAADRVLAARTPVPPPPVARTPWHEDGELMDLFQDLLTAGVHDDGALALRHIERLRQSLRLRHGVETVEFDDEHEACFAYAEHTRPDDTGYVTVKPALVRAHDHQRVLVRGEARGPAMQRDGVPAEPPVQSEGSSHV